ncbi:isoprenylcysteine carboxylmethyltransferase family protein [Nocardioides maradonensis]
MRRTLLLAFATVADAGFLLAVAWSVVFLADLRLLTTVDGPAHLGAADAALVDLALLGAFAVHHSVMARPAAKRLLTRCVPPAAERSTYVLGADVLLLLTLGLWQPIAGDVWRLDGPWRGPVRAAYVGGWIVAIASTFMIDHLALVGLRQAAGRDRPSRFQVRWLYVVVRHPLMLGLLIAFWATPTMTWGHLLFAAAASGYIAVGIRLEERDLRRELPAYADYARTTPAVLPRLRRS